MNVLNNYNLKCLKLLMDFNERASKYFFIKLHFVICSSHYVQGFIQLIIQYLLYYYYLLILHMNYSTPIYCFRLKHRNWLNYYFNHKYLLDSHHHQLRLYFFIQILNLLFNLIIQALFIIHLTTGLGQYYLIQFFILLIKSGLELNYSNHQGNCLIFIVIHFGFI